MVRCSKCLKTVKAGIASSWDDGMCPECWNKKPPLEYVRELPIKRKTNPFDDYLNYWTVKELIRTGH